MSLTGVALMITLQLKGYNNIKLDDSQRNTVLCSFSIIMTNEGNVRLVNLFR